MKIIKTPSLLGFYLVLNTKNNYRGFNQNINICNYYSEELPFDWPFFTYIKRYKYESYILFPIHLENISIIDENFYLHKKTENNDDIEWEFHKLHNEYDEPGYYYGGVLNEFENDEEMIRYINKFFRNDKIRKIKHL